MSCAHGPYLANMVQDHDTCIRFRPFVVQQTNAKLWQILCPRSSMCLCQKVGLAQKCLPRRCFAFSCCGGLARNSSCSNTYWGCVQHLFHWVCNCVIIRRTLSLPVSQLIRSLHLGAVDMDIYGAFQLCSIGVLAAPVTVKLSRTYFYDPGRNIIFAWTALILAGE